MLRKLFILLPVAAIGLGGSTACATKKFVRTSVGDVNNKADALGASLEETQERTRQNEATIRDVDQRAQAASASASEARQVADTANTAAAAATATGTAAAMTADAVDLRTKKVVFEVVLSEDAGDFKSGMSNLPDDAKARLDEMIAKIVANPNGAFFEISGHTDSTGSKESNQRLGLERAETVKLYLYEHYQIPLHKINVISYGQEKPVAPNKTREGRAKNRRVVIQVLT